MTVCTSGPGHSYEYRFGILKSNFVCTAPEILTLPALLHLARVAVHASQAAEESLAVAIADCGLPIPPPPPACAARVAAARAQVDRRNATTLALAARAAAARKPLAGAAAAEAAAEGGLRSAAVSLSGVKRRIFWG